MVFGMHGKVVTEITKQTLKNKYKRNSTSIKAIKQAAEKVDMRRRESL